MGISGEFYVTCDQRRDSIFLLAADQLEPAESESLRRHLSTGCPICAGALAEAEATLAQMTLAIEAVEPSEKLRGALMARIGETGVGETRIGETSIIETRITETRVTDTSQDALSTARESEDFGDRPMKMDSAAPSPLSTKASSPASLRTAAETRGAASRYRIFAASLLSAAAAVAITSGIFLYSTRMERAFFHSSNLQTVSLTSNTQPAARGQVLWDRDHHQWRVSVFNLSAPPPGREYELWLIPPGGKPMRSKTFNVDQSGKASIMVAMPSEIGPIAQAAITDEPIGGMDAPTGKIQLIGVVQ